MSDENKVQAESSVDQQGIPAAAPVQLTLQHIETMLSVINVTSRRGAYKPEEMTVVGNLYNDLALFLKQNTPVQEPEAAGAAAEEPKAE